MLDPERPLYYRLGGYDAIAAFADDLLPRLMNDPQLGAYWRGKCKDSLKKERQLLVDFLSSAFGGPVHYAGRDMKTSHEGLAISEGELDVLGVAEREKAEVLAAAASLKGDIVETSKAAHAG